MSGKLDHVFQLRFTTMVEAPLTVAFDVARSLGRPWRQPLREVVSKRPWRDVYEAAPGYSTSSGRCPCTSARNPCSTRMTRAIDTSDGGRASR